MQSDPQAGTSGEITAVLGLLQRTLEEFADFIPSTAALLEDTLTSPRSAKVINYIYLVSNC
jgi:hypothetical protein